MFLADERQRGTLALCFCSVRRDLHVFATLIHCHCEMLKANVQGLPPRLLASSELVVRVAPELTGNRSLYVLSLTSVITSLLTSSFGKRYQERERLHVTPFRTSFRKKSHLE